MANNQYVNKVIYGGNTLIDITDTTAVVDKVLAGYFFYGASGEKLTGTCTFNADTSDANATAAEILTTKTAYVNGNKITGSMTNQGSVSGTISTKDDAYTIPAGYHDGGGKCQLASSQKALLIPNNIKAGITLLGVLGDYSGEAISAQSKTVSPTVAGFTVQPDTGYDYLSSVVVNPISFVETDNQWGGKTVTIAGS